MCRACRTNLLIIAAILLTVFLIMTLGSVDFHKNSGEVELNLSETDRTPAFIYRLMDFFNYDIGDINSEGLLEKITAAAVLPFLIFCLIVTAVMLVFSGSARREVFTRIAAILFVLGFLSILNYFKSDVNNENSSAVAPIQQIENIAAESIPTDRNIESPDKRDIPPLLPYIVTGLIFSLIVFLLFYRGRRTDYRQESNDLKDITEQALSSLDEGIAYREVILQCYSEMMRILKEKKGVERSASTTPEEFCLLLEKEGLPSIATAELTSLFEKVRYGSRQLTSEEEGAARKSLEAIVYALESL